MIPENRTLYWTLLKQANGRTVGMITLIFMMNPLGRAT